MKKLIAVFLLVAFCLPGFALAQAKQKISMLLYNGKIFTADENYSMAEAVAVDGERIVAVGTTKDLRAKYAGAQEIDLQGKLVTPGFNDAHVHFLRGALALLTVNVEGTKSLAEAQAKVAARVKEIKPGEWIIGRAFCSVRRDPSRRYGRIRCPRRRVRRPAGSAFGCAFAIRRRHTSRCGSMG